jgi:hypothetical protein
MMKQCEEGLSPKIDFNRGEKKKKTQPKNQTFIEIAVAAISNKSEESKDKA